MPRLPCERISMSSSERSDSNSFIAERIASSTFLPVNSLNVIAFGLVSSCRRGAGWNSAAVRRRLDPVAALGRIGLGYDWMVDRSRYAALRRKGLLHDLRFREGASPSMIPNGTANRLSRKRAKNRESEKHPQSGLAQDRGRCRRAPRLR